MTHADISLIAAFDMRVPSDRASLNALLRPTPIEIAKERHHAAWRRIDRFVLCRLPPVQRVAFLLVREPPVDLPPDLAAHLNALLVAERVARAQIAGAAAPPIRNAA